MKFFCLIFPLKNYVDFQRLSEICSKWSMTPQKLNPRGQRPRLNSVNFEYLVEYEAVDKTVLTLYSWVNDWDWLMKQPKSRKSHDTIPSNVTSKFLMALYKTDNWPWLILNFIRICNPRSWSVSFKWFNTINSILWREVCKLKVQMVRVKKEFKHEKLYLGKSS
jgi:hypothetical protein